MEEPSSYSIQSNYSKMVEVIANKPDNSFYNDEDMQEDPL
jgi:hypothetical protein